MTTAATTTGTSSPSDFVKFFERVGHDIVVAASAVKNIFVKAAQDEPAITGFVQKYGGEAEALLESLSPAASALVGTAIKTWGVIANDIDKNGAAAEQNFLNQGADQTLIDSIKSSISTVKAVAGPPPTSSTASAATDAPALAPAPASEASTEPSTTAAVAASEAEQAAEAAKAAGVATTVDPHQPSK